MEKYAYRRVKLQTLAKATGEMLTDATSISSRSDHYPKVQVLTLHFLFSYPHPISPTFWSLFCVVLDWPDKSVLLLRSVVLLIVIKLSLDGRHNF
jgi:hypothetical protein